MSKIEKRFDLYSCLYGLSRDKQYTIRGQLAQIGIKKGFTLENSYFGYEENKKYFPYKESDLKHIGKSILQSLYILECSNGGEVQKHYGFNKNHLFQELVKKIEEIQRQEKKHFNTKQVLSDSDPEADKFTADQASNIYEGKKIKQDKKVKQIYSKTITKVNKKNLKNTASSRKKNKKERKQSMNARSSHSNSSLSFDQGQNKAKIFSIAKNKKIFVQEKFKINSQKKKFQPSSSPIHKKINEKKQASQKKFKNQNKFEGLFGKSFKHKEEPKVRIFSQIKTQLSHTSEPQLKKPKQKQKMMTSSHKFADLKERSLKVMLKDTVSIFGVTAHNRKKLRFIDEKKPLRYSGVVTMNNSSNYAAKRDVSKLKVLNYSQKKIRSDSQLSDNEQKRQFSMTQKIQKQKAYKRFQHFKEKKEEERKEQTGTYSSVFYYPIV